MDEGSCYQYTWNKACQSNKDDALLSNIISYIIMNNSHRYTYRYSVAPFIECLQ